MDMKAKIIIISFSFWSMSLNAMVRDTIPPADSLKPVVLNLPDGKEKKNWFVNIKEWTSEKTSKAKDFLNDEEPKPSKALGLSLVLPGAGQAYNDKHWKIPIVYGALGGLSYLVSTNSKLYRRYKQAYIYRLDEDESTIDEFDGIITDANVIRRERDAYRKNLERAYAGLFIVYILNGIDAFVDAHLDGFNIDEDFGMKLRPSIRESDIGGRVWVSGLSWSIPINRVDKEVLPNKELFEEELKSE